MLSKHEIVVLRCAPILKASRRRNAIDRQLGYPLRQIAIFVIRIVIPYVFGVQSDYVVHQMKSSGKLVHLPLYTGFHDYHHVKIHTTY